MADIRQVQAGTQDARRIRHHATCQHRLRTLAAERGNIIDLRLNMLLARNVTVAGMKFDRRSHRAPETADPPVTVRQPSPIRCRGGASGIGSAR